MLVPPGCIHDDICEQPRHASDPINHLTIESSAMLAAPIGHQHSLAPEAVPAPIEVLIHVTTLESCGWAEVGRIGLLSRRIYEAVLAGGDPLLPQGAWPLLCTLLARTRLLYCPRTVGLEGWRCLFLEQLLPARGKWQVGTERSQTQCDFKIQVAVRFRAGSHSSEAVMVPLHQRLQAARVTGSTAAEVFGDEREPEEFKCALLGGIMIDPVRLPSGPACERRVAEAQLRHSASDPFSGEPVTVDSLVPDTDLRERIREWRAGRRSEDAGDRLKLGEDQIRELVNSMGGNLSPEVVEALLEAERMKSAGTRALQDAADAPAHRPIRQARAAEAWVAEAAGDADDNITAMGREGLANVVGDSWDDGGGADGRHGAGNDEAAILEEEPDRAAKIASHGRILQINPPTSIAMFQPGTGVRPFIFPRVFGGHASQEDVYNKAARGAVAAALNGFNACMLCYGQTGSGKTHSMFGPDGILHGDVARNFCNEALTTTNAGIVLRAAHELFEAVANFQQQGVRVSISAQYVQIYGETVSCLASGRGVRMREETVGAPVLLQGAECVACVDANDFLRLMRTGEALKHRAETAMNHRSSRAHTVLALTILQVRDASPGVAAARSASQLHLVDLAGSERVKKSRATGSRFREAVCINSSLVVLGRCISALVEEARHVPYYESQLTLLLRSAFGGTSRTTAIVCCRQEDEHGDETLQTLRFGERCAAVTNQASTCVASSVGEALAAIDAALRQCEEQLRSLDERGRSGLPAYSKLQTRYAELRHRRADLAKATGGG